MENDSKSQESNMAQSQEQSGRPVSGDVVLTAYGVAVITKCSSVEDGKSGGSKRGVCDDSSTLFEARLWRIPGKSIGSCAIAYLRRDTILKRLPAAPGMVTTTARKVGNVEKGHEVLVHCYSASADKYLVSTIDRNKTEALESLRKLSIVEHDNDGGEMNGDATESPKNSNVSDDPVNESGNEPLLIDMRPNEIEPSKSAKFYPLIVELMRRGDQAAAATSLYLNRANIDKIMSKSSDVIDSAGHKKKDGVALPSDHNMVKIATSSSSSSLAEAIVPEKEEIQQIYTMLKDEELTVLLEKGRDRLRQLLSTNISQETKLALEKRGIVITDATSDGTGALSLAQSSIVKSREKALYALDQLLKENMEVDMKTIRESLGENFTVMFDSLSYAAKSDRTLNSIFDMINEKTSDWQELTGRLASTKSASLFFEGAQRLQARAAKLFSRDQLSWATEVGARLSKAFTEGDAAVARLKSIELGDAVRNRLVAAIEVRSNSQGGLDGIIAGALGTVNDGSLAGVTGRGMQQMLTDLQKTASSATKNAHETLISMLSQKSVFRDEAILRIEKALTDLDSQLGDDLSAQDIVAIARGEGGTAKLFEPIARKAAKEIERQLDVAESTVTDPTILMVLEHVRRIISGELTMAGLFDEVVNVLNDEKVVAASETLVKHGEYVLDVIEGTSGKKAVGDVMQVMEKSGLTKEMVMKHMETLDVNEIMDTAESAVADEKARRQLISSATDSALDFLLRILPSMPVPPFDGVRDGLVYHISNLSMEGFKVKKEDITVEIAGIRATKKSTEKSGPAICSTAEESPNDIDMEKRTNEMIADANISDSLSSDGDVSNDLDTRTDTSGNIASAEEEEKVKKTVKATELLIIDIRNISAVLDNAVWSFEQTYLPYLKGSGMANVKLSNGSIRLQFELRRMRVNDNGSSRSSESSRWEPVLCLHDRRCAIEDVDLILQGEGRITWILNKLANLFRGPLRDYVVRVITNVLTNQSGVLLEKLNDTLSRYWGLILRTASLTMEDLVEVSDDVVTKGAPDKSVNEVELVWRERVPLGINLLTNDESGLLKVVDFPRGTQARKVALARDMDPDAFKGATIVAVNGRRYETQDDLFFALKDPGRPKSVLFELVNSEEAERIQRFVDGSDEKASGDAANIGKSPISNGETVDAIAVKTVEITEEGELGMRFSSSPDNYGLIVESFFTDDDGHMLVAERNGKIMPGDMLAFVNGVLVLGENGTGMQRALSLLEREGHVRPLSLGFVEPYLHLEVFKKPESDVQDFGGPDEFLLGQNKLATGGSKVILTGFADANGMAENGGVLVGDHLAFINGIPVGVGCQLFQESAVPEFDEVIAMLEDKGSYPVALTFARPGKEQRRWYSAVASSCNIESAETFCVAASNHEQLGCTFGLGRNYGDVVVTNVHGVPGPLQQKMKSAPYFRKGMILSIESVDGQVVPSYATGDMVRSALKRSWSTNGGVEVLFSDDSKREGVMNLISSSNR